MEKPLLTVSNLKVEVNKQLILNDINLEAKRNETLAIIGPNGAGKTMLFRALLGLIPYEGEIMWKPGVKIGYVPQRFYIEPDLPLTTAEFFALKENHPKEIAATLAAVGFEEDKPHKGHVEEHILKRRLGVLSGGELQRVLIAWALVGHPDILLFDEPTTGVDVSAEETIYGLLHKLQEKEKMAVMLISHDLQVVYRYATKVVCLNKERLCYGPPREVLDKESLARLYGNDVGVYQHHHGT